MLLSSMVRRIPARLVTVVGLFFVLAIVAGVAATTRCSPIPEQPPEVGSQGYRVWSGDTLRSFEHGNKQICVPEGWQPLGATTEGDGWARFQKGATGLVVRTDGFASTSIEPALSGYTVKVLYPVGTPPELLTHATEILANAFTRVGRLYGTNKAERSHTVLITAGLAGNTKTENSRVYPDPGPDVTMFVRTPEQFRAEELAIHAVVHLFNRHRQDLLEYQHVQQPVPPEDWQELEASWAEVAFHLRPVARTERARYLYNVHTAVRTNDFALIAEPPFNDAEGFKRIVPHVAVPSGSDYLDYQYGHYVLAPLVMLAAEGLLLKHNAPIDVEGLLVKVHGEGVNFFDELRTVLPSAEVTRIQTWMDGTATIPEELVDSAVQYYR